MTWVYPAPSRAGQPVGYLRVGTSVPLRMSMAVAGEGCHGDWWAVEPYGYVCDDGQTTTRHLDDPIVRAQPWVAMQPDQNLPYRYALSGNAPMYERIPSLNEQTMTEGPPERRLGPASLSPWLHAHEALAVDTPIDPTDELPPFLRDGATLPSTEARPGRLVRKWIPNGSMLSYSRAFSASGRTWLLTPDLRLVPADRVRAFRPSLFQGITLNEQTPLPVAWARSTPSPLYRLDGEHFVPITEQLAIRTFVRLTGETYPSQGRVFWRTSRTDGAYVAESEVAVARTRQTAPVEVGENGKWIEVRLRTGTLTAYEGRQPVYTTLISPGAGGPGETGATNRHLVERSQTPIGTYPIVWKDRASRMTPEKGDPVHFWIADVPFIMYFRAPFALHVAYWHEDFGLPKSAGCINLSPRDGRFLFDWVDPPVPDPWQGASPRPVGGGGRPATLVLIAP